MKTIQDLLYEAEQSLENMHKPSYNKKAWYHNFYLCMDRIFKRGADLEKDEDIEKYNKLCEEWK